MKNEGFFFPFEAFEFFPLAKKNYFPGGKKKKTIHTSH